ncbi:hypothetical protein RND81_03G160500 [Saponaria officinalis]|uniref:Uncharacterized protein n=1 Tax=Saponaria officinalis TaxID=3572 RepID=A0AAW1M9N2_SAPOF
MMNKYGGIDLRAMEILKEKHDLDEGDEGDEGDEETTIPVFCDLDERLIKLRNSLVKRQVFMKFFCKNWPRYGFLLEYEIEQIDWDKNLVYEEQLFGLDPEFIRSNPVFVKWVLQEVSKYWRGFDLAFEDDFTG